MLDAMRPCDEWQANDGARRPRGGKQVLRPVCGLPLPAAVISSGAVLRPASRQRRSNVALRRTAVSGQEPGRQLRPAPAPATLPGDARLRLLPPCSLASSRAC
jgi:hypothetical protein